MFFQENLGRAYICQEVKAEAGLGLQIGKIVTDVTDQFGILLVTCICALRSA